MTTMASQITSLTVVYSIVYSGADQRKHQCSASLAFVRGIHRDRWIPRTNGQKRGKCFHLMTSSRYFGTLKGTVLGPENIFHFTIPKNTECARLVSIFFHNRNGILPPCLLYLAISHFIGYWNGPGVSRKHTVTEPGTRRPILSLQIPALNQIV